MHGTRVYILLITRALLAKGCDSPYLLGFLVELLQWRLDGEQDEAKVTNSFRNYLTKLVDLL